jgi:hypothetical protein
MGSGISRETAPSLAGCAELLMQAGNPLADGRPITVRGIRATFGTWAEEGVGLHELEREAVRLLAAPVSTGRREKKANGNPTPAHRHGRKLSAVFNRGRGCRRAFRADGDEVKARVRTRRLLPAPRASRTGRCTKTRSTHYDCHAAQMRMFLAPCFPLLP